MHVNSPGEDSPELSSRHRAERYLPLLPIGGAMFMLSALVYFRLRHDTLVVSSPLQVFVAWSYQTFGLAPGILGCVLLLTWGSIWFVNGRWERVGSRLARIAAMVVLLGVFFNLGESGVTPSFHKGTLGAYLAGTLADIVGPYPGIVLVWAMTVASLLLATDFGFREEWERLRANTNPSSDRGVEDEVAEVLKGLGGTVAMPGFAAPSTGEVAAAFPMPDATVAPRVPGARESAVDVALTPPELAVGQDDDEVEVQPEETVAEAAVDVPQRRRASYFERRYAQYEPVAESDWAPATPENQEFDNPEAEFLAQEAAAQRVETAGQVPDEVSASADLRMGGEAVAADDMLHQRAAADENARRADDDAAVARGLAQRGLFDAPLPAPRAPVGGWIAEAASADPVAGDSVDLEAAGHEAFDDDLLVLEDDLVVVDEHRAERSGGDAASAAGSSAEAMAAKEHGADAGETEVGETEAEVVDVDAVDLDDDAVDLDVDAVDLDDDDVGADDSTRDQQDASEAFDADDSAAAGREAVRSDAGRGETVVPIPRPDAGTLRGPAAPAFADAVIAEAIEVVEGSGRASAALLQRKLRIDFEMAQSLLHELARRGVVELADDAAHGRLLR